VFQGYHLLPALTAWQNVQLPMLGVVAGARVRAERARELLERVGLGVRLRHLPSQLSGGERQRVAIARSLANGPDLILADEPTGNLDSVASAEILDLLTEVRGEQGAALVLVTHDPAVAARCERVVRLRDGRVVDEARA
ncbi:ATP-binding cassette domain-containing protein, partial [Arthrospira platensis SPKY2]